MRRFVLLAVMTIGCIICSGTVFAMQFYQMEEVGYIGISQAGGGSGGIYVGNASANTGDYYRVYNKNNKFSFGKGVARFGNGEDALFINYNAYQENNRGVVYCGAENKANTVQMEILNDFIYKINTDSGITLYPIRFWYSYEADMIFSVAYNMHFYKNTKFQSPYLERKQDMMIEVPSDYDNSSYDAYRLK